MSQRLHEQTRSRFLAFVPVLSASCRRSATRKQAVRSLLFTSVLAACALLWGARRASAQQGDPLHAARQAEVDGNPKRAAEYYRAVLATNPAASVERQAEARFNWLMARSDDDFKPLAALFKLEVADRESPSAKRLISFEKTIDGFQPGLVRREARAFVASALNREGDLSSAYTAYQAWLAEPGLDPADRRIAVTGMLHIDIKRGELSAGMALLKREGFGVGSEERQLRQLQIIHVGDPIARGLIVLFALGVLVSLAGVLRQRRWSLILSWQRLGLALFLVSVPIILGTMYLDTLAARFWRLGWGLSGVLLMASIAGVGLQGLKVKRGWITAMAVSACLACLAVGFIAAEQTEMFEMLLLWHGI